MARLHQFLPIKGDIPPTIPSRHRYFFPVQKSIQLLRSLSQRLHYTGRRTRYLFSRNLVLLHLCCSIRDTLCDDLLIHYHPSELFLLRPLHRGFPTLYQVRSVFRILIQENHLQRWTRDIQVRSSNWRSWVRVHMLRYVWDTSMRSCFSILPVLRSWRRFP
jgi:hypothetical protein